MTLVFQLVDLFQDKAQERGVSHLVVLNDKDIYTVKSFERDQKATETKVLPGKIVEYLRRQVHNIEDGVTASRWFKLPSVFD